MECRLFSARAKASWWGEGIPVEGKEDEGEEDNDEEGEFEDHDAEVFGD